MRPALRAINYSLAFATLTLACQGKQDASNPAISGGHPWQEADPGLLKQSIVALAFNNDFHHKTLNPRSAFCTGVLIAPRLILTAAHCAENPLKRMYYAVFSTSMPLALKDHKNTTRQVASVIKHSGYPDRWVEKDFGMAVENDYERDPESWLQSNPLQSPHDLAILVLSSDAPASAQAISLGESAADPERFTLAGFGISNSTLIDDSGILRVVSGVRVFAPNEEDRSRHYLRAAETLSVAAISQGERPKGACMGDSGAPAFVETGTGLELAGILSVGEWELIGKDATWGYCLGKAEGSGDKPGNYFMDIRAYRDWIREVMAQAQ